MQVFKRGLGSTSRFVTTTCCTAARRAPLVAWTRVRSVQTTAETLTRTGQNNRRQQKSPPPVYDHDWQPPKIDVALRTLRPDNLVASDSVDLSDGRGVVYDPHAEPSASPPEAPYLTYGRRQIYWSKTTGVRKLTYTPFPVNTRGFFYYRAHPCVSEGGALRFRVVPSRDPAHFAAGADLETEFGTPWQIPLIAIATQARYALVRTLLEREGLVTPDDWARAEALAKSIAPNRVGAMSQIVFQAGEPFYVDVAEPLQTVYVAGEGQLQRVTPRNIFMTRYQKEGYSWRYAAGVLRCALHLVESGRKKDEKAVCVEVQREIEPVREKGERVVRSRYVLPPVPGQLLQMHNGVNMNLFLSPAPSQQAVKKSLFRRGMQGGSGQQIAPSSQPAHDKPKRKEAAQPSRRKATGTS